MCLGVEMLACSWKEEQGSRAPSESHSLFMEGRVRRAGVVTPGNDVAWQLWVFGEYGRREMLWKCDAICEKIDKPWADLVLSSKSFILSALHGAQIQLWVERRPNPTCKRHQIMFLNYKFNQASSHKGTIEKPLFKHLLLFTADRLCICAAE